MGSKRRLHCKTIEGSPHEGESGFRNPPWKFCLWDPEFWALEFGIQLEESGIPLTIGMQPWNENSRGLGGLKEKCPPWGRGMDVFWNYINDPRLSWISLASESFRNSWIIKGKSKQIICLMGVFITDIDTAKLYVRFSWTKITPRSLSKNHKASVQFH